MQITPVSYNYTNKTQKNNSKPAFGMKFVLPKTVADEFIQGLSNANVSSDMRIHMPDAIVQAKGFVTELARDSIAHNKTAEKHFVYGDVKRITNIDIVNDGVPLLKSPQNFDFFAEFEGSNYHIKFQDGDTYSINEQSIGENIDDCTGPYSNLADSMQKKLIADKTATPQKAEEDLEYLCALTESTAK